MLLTIGTNSNKKLKKKKKSNIYRGSQLVFSRLISYLVKYLNTLPCFIGASCPPIQRRDDT